MFRSTSAPFLAKASLALRTATSAPLPVKPLGFPRALMATHPVLAASWLGTTMGKFDSPQTLTAASNRLSWWNCSSCSSQYRRRITDQVAAHGMCPNCNHTPTALEAATPIPKEVIANRPISTNASRMCLSSSAPAKRHITDIPFFAESLGGYLRKMLQPMLAQTVESHGHQVRFNDESVFVSPKLDGIRCLVARDPTDGAIYCFSRQGVLFESCDHLLTGLERLFEQDPTAVLDGELYYNGPTPTHERMPFEVLLSAMSTRKAYCTPRMAELQSLVQFHVFDVTYSGALGLGKGFTERLGHLEAMFAPTRKMPRAAKKSPGRRGKASSDVVPADTHVQLVPHARITSIEEAYAARDALLAVGYEGAMLRRGTAPYGHGKRSPHLLKLKTMDDAEYEIVGALEGEGKLAGSLGAFICRTPSGETFSVSPSVDENGRRALWMHWEKLVGSALTVQYQGLTCQGLPRFPVGKAIRGATMKATSWL